MKNFIPAFRLNIWEKRVTTQQGSCRELQDPGGTGRNFLWCQSTAAHFGSCLVPFHHNAATVASKAPNVWLEVCLRLTFKDCFQAVIYTWKTNTAKTSRLRNLCHCPADISPTASQPHWLLCAFVFYDYNNVSVNKPSPVLEVARSESSLVPFWESRYVAGTQPCCSDVLTNHQPEAQTHKHQHPIFTTSFWFTPNNNYSSFLKHFQQ